MSQSRENVWKSLSKTAWLLQDTGKHILKTMIKKRQRKIKQICQLKKITFMQQNTKKNIQKRS